MRRSYIIKLALKNISGHKLRAALTIAGIAIGVGFIIFLVSLGYGLQRISTQEIANLDALQMIDVTPGKSKIIKIDDETINRFSELTEVEKTAPQLDLVGTITFNSSVVEGVVYAKDLEYLNLEEVGYSAGGSYESNNSKQVLINTTAMRQLGYSNAGEIIDQKVTINVNVGTEYLEDGVTEPLFYKEDLEIAGVLSNDTSPYVYMPLTLYKKEGISYYSSARVKTTSKSYTDKVKQQLESLGFKTVTLKDTVDQINQFFAIFQLILLSFGAIAVVIAALGMFNTLTISLLEKTREVSFMKVMGTTSNDIWKIFLGEALVIGFLGALLGILGGLAVGEVINDILRGLAERTGNKSVEIFYIPFIYIFITFSGAMLISFLTGIYPSYRASKIDALEALRYE